MSNPYPNYKRNTITVPAQKRPQNCGTSYCSCIECVMESAQQEPEFFTHNVEQPYDWSEWVCPDPQGYLMKCCDCGLVHEAEFGVVRYKSETEREDCDIVDDPNLQAVFRMRRSEQWSPVDTAHRAGGMPMEQPVQPQQEPWRPDVCPITGLPFFMWIEHHETGQMVPTYGGPYDSYTIPVREKDGSYCRERYDHDNGWWVTDEVEDVGVQIVSDQAYVSEDEPPAQRKPLPEDQLLGIWNKAITQDNGRGSHLSNQPFVHIARAIEAAHGIKENT